MATLLLAVILVSGFIYVNLSLSTRYRYKRSNGWDAYFFVAAWGIVFFSPWRFFHLYFERQRRVSLAG